MADDSYTKFQELVKKSKYAPKDDAPPPTPKPSDSKPNTSKPDTKPPTGKTEVVKVRNTNPDSPNFGQMEEVKNYYDSKGQLVASEKINKSTGEVTGAIAKGGSIGGFKGKVTQTTTPQSTASIGAGIGLSSGNAALGSAVGGGVLQPTAFGGVAPAPMGVQPVGSAVGGGTLFTVKGAFGAQEPKRFIEIGTGTQGESIYQQQDAPKKYVPTMGARVGSSINRKEVLTQQPGPFGGMQIKSENILKLNIQQQKEMIAKEGFARSIYSPNAKGSLGQIILAPQGGRQQGASFILTGPLFEGGGKIAGAAGESFAFIFKGEGPGSAIAQELKAIGQASLKPLGPSLQGAISGTGQLLKTTGQTAGKYINLDKTLTGAFAAYTAGESAKETYTQTGDVVQAAEMAALTGVKTTIQFGLFEKGMASGAAATAKTIDSLSPAITRVGSEIKVKETILARKSGSSTAVTMEKFAQTPLKAGQEFKLTTVKGTGQSFTQRVFGIEQEKVLQKQMYTEQFGKAIYSGSVTESSLRANVLANGKTENTFRQFISGEGPSAMIPEIQTERFSTLGGKLKVTDGIGKFQAVAKVGRETLRTDQAAKQELSVQTRPIKDSDFAIFGLESDITVKAGKTEERTILETTVPEQLFEYGPATPVTRTVTDEIFFEAPTVKIRTRIVPRPGQYTTAAESELTFVERPSTSITRIETFENDLTTEIKTSTFESKPTKLTEGKAQRIVNIPEPKQEVKVTYGGKVEAELVQEFKFSQGTNRLRLTSDATDIAALEFDGTRGLSARARESTYREFKPRAQVPSDFFEEGYGLKLETKKATQRYQSTFNAASAQFYKATESGSEVMVKSYSMPGKPAIQSKFIPRVAQVMGLRFDRQTLSKNITQQIQDQKIKAKQLGDIKNILKPSTESRIGSLYETKITSMLKSDLAQGLKRGQELKSMLKQTVTQNTQLKSQSTTRFDFTRPGRDVTFRGGKGEVPPSPEVPLLPKFGDFKLDFTKQSNGYNTYVREKGKLVKVNKQPQYREQAERQGRYYVEHSTAAAYKVVPTNKPASLNQENVPDVSSSEFRPSKRGGFTVEKNKFRINTPEEKAGITAKGLRAIRNRNTFKFGNIKVKL